MLMQPRPGKAWRNAETQPEDGDFDYTSTAVPRLHRGKSVHFPGKISVGDLEPRRIKSTNRVLLAAIQEMQVIAYLGFTA